ncbi:hypothetical protein ACQ4WQ_13970 [Janthinobacterium sp. GB1R12]
MMAAHSIYLFHWHIYRHGGTSFISRIEERDFRLLLIRTHSFVFATYVNGSVKWKSKACIKSHALITGRDGDQDSYAGMHPVSLTA